MRTPKNFALAILLACLLSALQGCGETTMETMILLGEQDDPDATPINRVSRTEPAQQAEKEPCKLKVFHRYCLGNNIQPLLDTREPLHQQTAGPVTSYDYKDKYWLTTVTAFQGKIMRITRYERPASWRNMIALKQRLESAHGLSEDKSTYPSGANDPKSKQTAIFNGQAQALYEWKNPGWRLILLWDDMRQITATFVDEALERDYQAGLQ